MEKKSCRLMLGGGECRCQSREVVSVQGTTAASSKVRAVSVGVVGGVVMSEMAVVRVKMAVTSKVTMALKGVVGLASVVVVGDRLGLGFLSFRVFVS